MDITMLNLTFPQLVRITDHREINIVVSTYIRSPIDIFYVHDTDVRVYVSPQMFKFLKTLDKCFTKEEALKLYSGWWPGLLGLDRPIVSIA